MSYCRFSCDDFQCDLYVYESVYGGFVTHVAGNRVVFQEPLPAPVPFTEDHLDAWLERHQKVMAMMETVTRERITLPFAGETFGDDTLEGLIARLAELKALGYRYPSHVDEVLAAELAEQQIEGETENAA